MTDTQNTVIVMVNEYDPTRIAVIYPTGDVPIEELIQRHVDISKPYMTVDINDLPVNDNDFFDAWSIISKDDGGYNVVVNMEKARNIHREKLRIDRKQILDALDVQFMRAIERADIETQNEIISKKQKLRDLPAHPSIDEATTTSQLRALTIEVLTA